MIIQQPPYNIQIELVRGCQLRCPMCGINGLNLPRDSFQFMDVSLATKLAEEIAAWKPKVRIEFSLMGEPTQHPRLDEILGIFRQSLPNTHLLLTTNGLNLWKDWPTWRKRLRLCNILVVDLYDPYGPKLEKLLLDQPGEWKIHNYYDKDFTQHHNQGGNGHHLVLIPDLLKNTGRKRTRVIWNHAGNSHFLPTLLKPYRRYCTFPFRQMIILWEGSVALCCMDSGCDYKLGDAKIQSLPEIWASKAAVSMRRLLRYKYRSVAPCVRCDVPNGFRVGMLPFYPEPDQKVWEYARKINYESPRLSGFPARAINNWQDDSAYQGTGHSVKGFW